MDSSQIEKELTEIRKELKNIYSKNFEPISNGESMLLMKLLDERENTNRTLQELTSRLNVIDKTVKTAISALELAPTQEDYAMANSVEIDLSPVDAKVINYIQTKGMACAEDVQRDMNYKGKNAACARMNALCKRGLLSKHQLGHKIYYRFDAGKANTIIISPP